MAFRENILHLRAANNMTQEQLAMLVGVSRQSVAKWESGKAYPEMDKLIALSQIFNCTIDALVQGDLTDHEPAATVPVTDTPQDLFGYDEFMRGFARRISNGVMCIILGVAFGVLCFGIAKQGGAYGSVSYFMQDILGMFGVILVLVGSALGLASIIPAGLEHSAFVQDHPYLEDFYTQTQKQQARKSFSNQLVTGIICIFAGVCLTVLFDMFGRTETLAPFCMLILTAIGVRLIVNGSMTLNRVNIAAYNAAAQAKGIDGSMAASAGEAAEARRRRTKTDNRIGACCGIIMIVATIAGLVMLFVPEHHTELFWLAWPIGGLLCGIVALLFKAVTGEE